MTAPLPDGAMFLNFFFELERGIPVSVKEYLTFLNAVDAGIAGKKIDDFIICLAPRW